TDSTRRQNCCSLVNAYERSLIFAATRGEFSYEGKLRFGVIFAGSRPTIPTELHFAARLLVVVGLTPRLFFWNSTRPQPSHPRKSRSACVRTRQGSEADAFASHAPAGLGFWPMPVSLCRGERRLRP